MLVKGVIGHMAFTRKGLRKTVSKLPARGVSHKLRKLRSYGTRQLFFHDPNDAKIEIDFDSAESPA